MVTTSIIFVENLSLRLWFLIVFSWLWNWLIKRRTKLQLYYFAASKCSLACAEYLCRFVPVDLKEADYSWVDIRNPSDELCYLRILTQDAPYLWQSARIQEMEGNAFLGRLSERFDRDRLLLYIAKCVDEEVRWILFRISVVEWFWQHGRLKATDNLIYYARRSRWSEYIEDYATHRRISIRWYRSLLPCFETCLRYVRLFVSIATVRKRAVTTRGSSKLETIGVSSGKPSCNKNDAVGCFPEVAVLYTGRELAFDPMKNSDVFWLPYSVYGTEGIVMYSAGRNGRMPFRRVTMKSLSFGFDESEVWSPWYDWDALRLWLRLEFWMIGQWLLSFLRQPRHPLWLLTKLSAFVLKYAYWHAFFRNFGVKLHVSHHDWSAERVAADQAVADLGGLSLSYQKSYEPFASTFRASAVDVHFTFGLSSGESELLSHSKISQLVVAGYIHDHSFDNVRPSASRLRKKLQHAGVDFIVCFLDENSSDDKKISVTHEQAGENYRYLFTKMLEDPTLGLILKPKKPATLRRRLGHVSALMDKVLATGRCFLFDEGQAASSVLPCEACQAADVAIGLLFGGTAAVESALAGTPTVLIDRERPTGHPLYELGQGQVIFQDWDSLWKALSAYRRDPAAVAGLGNWSSTLDELDSFRDGRAAERIGSYIGWLAEGIAKGLSREETMELARQRYVGVWGNDKVIQLRDSHARSWDAIGVHG
jgi:hypothetical protein